MQCKKETVGVEDTPSTHSLILVPETVALAAKINKGFFLLVCQGVISSAGITWTYVVRGRGRGEEESG